MSGFAENINYIAELDKKYGYSYSLSKSNISTYSHTYSATLTIGIYDRSIQRIVESSVSVTGVNALTFDAKVVELVTLANLLNTYTTYIGTSTANSAFASIGIEVTSNNTEYIIESLALALNDGTSDIYVVSGKPIESIAVLPYIATLDENILESVVSVSSNIEDIQNAEENALLAISARDKADAFANANRDVEIDPGKYSARHYMEESSDILGEVVLLEESVIIAESDANKIVNTDEDVVYTLSDGITTGYSAKHYAAKTNADSVSTANVVSDTIKITSTEVGVKYLLSDGTTEGYSSLHYADRAFTSRELAAESANSAYESMEAALISQTAASNSSAAASTKALEAGSSALAAAASETNAQTYMNEASASKNSASASAYTATQMATNASNSADSAELSRSNAYDLSLQVGNYATQVAANKLLAEAAMAQTGLDRIATANDVITTNADKLITNADAISTSADRVQTGLDRVATNSDVVQTGLDRTQTGLDRVQTGNDVVSSSASASEALASEIAAANSAFDASTILSQIEAIMDNFDDRYLGAKLEDPTLDNDGDALTIGAIYYNNTTNELRFYDGNTWDRPEYSASQSAIASEASRVASVNAKAAAELARDMAISNAASASASEAAAALSELNAEASATLADDRATFINELVLGAKASDPLTNNTGGDIKIGSVYYNTVSFAFRVYTGTEWRTAVFDASNAVSTFNGRTGTVELTEVDVNNAVGINIVESINANTNLIIGNTSSILQLAKSNTHGAFGSPSLSINVGIAPQVLPFSVVMQSTNTDRFIINSNNTITAKSSGTYVFNSTLNIEDVGANGAVRGLVFKITDGTSTWHTEVVNVEISNNDRDVIPVNSIVVLPEGATVPATAYITVEYPSGTSGYRIAGFQSVLATEKTVAELQGLASAVTVAANGNLSSTNVQSALEELQSDINGLDDYLGSLLTEELI